VTTLGTVSDLTSGKVTTGSESLERSGGGTREEKSRGGEDAAELHDDGCRKKKMSNKIRSSSRAGYFFGASVS